MPQKSQGIDVLTTDLKSPVESVAVHLRLCHPAQWCALAYSLPHGDRGTDWLIGGTNPGSMFDADH